MKLAITFRKWPNSPLFHFGKCTAHFHNGISFGKSYNSGDVVYYIAWLIVAKEIKWMTYSDSEQKAKSWLKVLRYSRGRNIK